MKVAQLHMKPSKFDFLGLRLPGSSILLLHCAAIVIVPNGLNFDSGVILQGL